MAAALAIQQGREPREVDVTRIQTSFSRQGSKRGPGGTAVLRRETVMKKARLFAWLLMFLTTPVCGLAAEPLVAIGGPKSVTVAVVDDRTSQPVLGFAYRIAIVTTDLRRSDEPGPWQDEQRLKVSSGSVRRSSSRVTVRVCGVIVISGDPRRSPSGS